MYGLTPASYSLVRPLFAGLGHHVAIGSIVEGHTPAWVYVDDPEAPETAWMWDLQGEMYLAGAAHRAATNRALGELITRRAVPQARARGVPGLALFCDMPAWEASLATVLPGLEPERAARRSYRFAGPALDWRAALPPGRSLHRLDERWFARRDVVHRDDVAGWVDSFWRSHAEFVRHSLGFALLDGEAAASWCLGVFASGDQVELAVATAPAYRRQGYATAVAARSVAFCAQQALTPHWHCWDDNVASWRVAEKAGFVDPTVYTVAYVDIRPPASDR